MGDINRITYETIKKNPTVNNSSAHDVLPNIGTLQRPPNYFFTVITYGYYAYLAFFVLAELLLYCETYTNGMKRNFYVLKAIPAIILVELILNRKILSHYVLSPNLLESNLGFHVCIVLNSIILGFNIFFSLMHFFVGYDIKNEIDSFSISKKEKDLNKEEEEYGNSKILEKDKKALYKEKEDLYKKKIFHRRVKAFFCILIAVTIAFLFYNSNFETGLSSSQKSYILYNLWNDLLRNGLTSILIYNSYQEIIFMGPVKEKKLVTFFLPIVYLLYFLLEVRYPTIIFWKAFKSVMEMSHLYGDLNVYFYFSFIPQVIYIGIYGGFWVYKLLTIFE